MPVKKDNPAGRLYFILEGLKELRGGGTIPNLASYFGLDQKDVSEIVDRLLLLLKITDEAEEAVSNVNGLSPELVNRAFPQIRHAINTTLISLSRGWDDARTAFHNINFTSLELCSELLSGRQLEKILEENELKNILEQIDNLSKDVLASSLADDLKAEILENLQAIRKAVINYDITGTNGIRRAQEVAFGNLIINSNLIIQEAKASDSFSVLEKYIKFVESLSKFISVVKTLLPLAPLLLGTGS